MTPNIHPTAIIAPGAEIANDVTIGPYCIVSGKVRIGKGTVLKAFVNILDYVEIGSECTFHENSVIGGQPQDHDFKGEETWVTIGDRNIIRENVTINRSSGEGTSTDVGDDCFIMEGVHLAHNVKVGNNVTMANKTGLAGHSSVGDSTVLGGISGVHQFVRIGRFCMIGGLSKIVKDIPPFLLVDGHPGRIYGINRIGLTRAGFSPGERSRIKEIYRSIFHSGLTFKRSLVKCESTFGKDILAEEILTFARDTRRGIETWPSFKRGSGKSD